MILYHSLMVLHRLSKLVPAALRAHHRWRTVLEHGQLPCEQCGHRIPLVGQCPLSFTACPKCGFNNYMPHLLGDLLLTEPLGAGGVSSVYQAYRGGQFDRMYAVKLLREDLPAEDQRVKSFMFEADVHCRVSPHPYIAEFVEGGECGGEYFHAMVFVRGHTVRKLVEQNGKLPEPLALKWTLQVLTALRHIAEHGFLYRDVSPGNLIVSPEGDVKLIDFGLALPLEEADRASAEAFIEGTPEYLPPERVARAGEDERSVIYSLGHLLCYMLKGEPLVRGSTHQSMAMQHISALRIAFDETMLPGVTAETVKLAARMIKPKPEDRPQSFAEVESNLREIVPANWSK